MTEQEIAIIKSCAALVAEHFEPSEPWISPNVILSRFNLPKWEQGQDYWYDPETGASYPF